MKTKLFLFLSFFFLSNAWTQVSIDLETGFYHVRSNDASSSWQNSFGELNGTTGSLFSYANDFSNKIKPLLRIRASYAFGNENRHFISFLAAPLQYHCTGSFLDTVVFNSQRFVPGKSVEGFYKFSGYRLTYRYYLYSNQQFTLGLGLTLNVRDAEFSLRQGNLYERNYNRGIVPLLNSYLQYQFYNKLSLLIDGDVFYIDKTGGAIDYLSALRYEQNEHLSIKFGYRFFSGVGSEIGNVYNRLFVSSAVLGMVYQF